MSFMFRPLRADEIECRVQSVKEKGLVLLLYKDARCDQNILDETVGPYNWKRSHSRENANCTVSIWDAEKEQWISKEDTGTESNTEAKKGLASDSFKRACFNWGIGRELYSAPFTWIPSDACKITKDPKGRLTCYDSFRVKEIEYANGTISKLIIENTETKRVCFRHEANSVPNCERCGKQIKWTTGKDGQVIPALEVAAIAQKKFHKSFCAECMKAANA